MAFFSASVKMELARLLTDRECCRRSELRALILTCGRLEIKKGKIESLSITCASAALARKVLLLLKGLFNLHTLVYPAQRGRGGKGGRIYHVLLPAQEGLAENLEGLGLKAGQGKEALLIYRRQPRLCCIKAYLRGAFLGGGSINPPDNDYHVELVVRTQRQARLLCRLMASFDLHPGLNQRKSQLVVYLKGSEQISDLLKVMGAHTSLLNYESIRVVKEVRNEVNRLVNAETANVNKMIEASMRQLEAIRFLRDHYGLQRLSDPLLQVAMLRLEHPDLSLKELGDMLDPKLGKSGVNHRLRRLEEKARKIQARQGEGGVRT